MAKEKNKVEQFDKIGGLLWFPAIWTVTNFPIAGYLIKVAPAIGLILMVLAVANAYLFWKRTSIYRWFFVVHSIAGVLLLAVATGPSGVGSGTAWTLLMMLYLLFSKRARGTFTQPLFRKPARPTVAES